MGRTNAKVDPRSEQEKYNADFDPRWQGNVRSQGEIDGSKYERTCRTDSSQSNFIDDGSPAVGKIVRHLIEKDMDQLAYKEEQKKRLEIEIAEIKRRIEENQSILGQVEASNKE
jgi:hypothetical protein